MKLQKKRRARRLGTQAASGCISRGQGLAGTLRRRLKVYGMLSEHGEPSTRRPAGRATGHAIEQPSSTAGAPSSSPGSRPNPSCRSGTSPKDLLRLPRGPPAARTRRSFAGRTNAPAKSSRPSSSRRGRRAIGSQTSTPSSRHSYGENDGMNKTRLRSPTGSGTATTAAFYIEKTRPGAAAAAPAARRRPGSTAAAARRSAPRCPCRGHPTHLPASPSAGASGGPCYQNRALDPNPGAASRPRRPVSYCTRSRAARRPFSVSGRPVAHGARDPPPPHLGKKAASAAPLVVVYPSRAADKIL